MRKAVKFQSLTTEEETEIRRLAVKSLPKLLRNIEPYDNSNSYKEE